MAGCPTKHCLSGASLVCLEFWLLFFNEKVTKKNINPTTHSFIIKLKLQCTKLSQTTKIPFKTTTNNKIIPETMISLIWDILVKDERPIWRLSEKYSDKGLYDFVTHHLFWTTVLKKYNVDDRNNLLWENFPEISISVLALPIHPCIGTGAGGGFYTGR